MTLKSTNILSFIALSDIISLLNMSSGFLSIIYSVNNEFTLAVSFILLAIMFDSVDGWVARKINRNDQFEFGKNIDSLSDVISFGVAPSILLYMLVTSVNVIPEVIGLIVCLFMVICGVLRLTRYNAISNKIKSKDFVGFPIPGIAIILVTFYSSGLFNMYIALLLMIITSLLMISNVKYPKFDNTIIIGISAILIFLILLQIPITIYGINIPAIILLILSLYYMIIHIIK